MPKEKGTLYPRNTTSLVNGDNVPHEGSLYASACSDQNMKDPDVIIVDWNGIEDSRNPMNWKPFQQYSQVFVVSAITLLTYTPHAIIFMRKKKKKVNSQTIY